MIDLFEKVSVKMFHKKKSDQIYFLEKRVKKGTKVFKFLEIKQ